jgi:hypothetical protein
VFLVRITCSISTDTNHFVMLKISVLLVQSFLYACLQVIMSQIPIKFLLTLTLLTRRIWWAPNNASRWQMGFNSEFKGLNLLQNYTLNLSTHTSCGFVILLPFHLWLWTNSYEIFPVFFGLMVPYRKGCIAYVLKIVEALKMETVRISKTSALESTPTLCYHPKIWSISAPVSMEIWNHLVLILR